jgi:putative tetratricopeptide repeat-containing domain protein
MKMASELCLIETDVLTREEKIALGGEIEHLIEGHKDNRQAINRLVFASIEAMTKADDAAQELSDKGFFKRFLGGITGSNAKLQDKINSNRAAAQYAAQQTLQKLAEQNLMTFDLITAVNNKLNASLHRVGEEIENIYEGLAKFLRHNKSELVRLETRLEKVERNVNLLTWQNSIEYQAFEGIEYCDLDEAGKIVCLVRDFYEITKGEWSTSELLLLKTAMGSIHIQPRDKVNFLAVLQEIAEDEALQGKLLGERQIVSADDSDWLLAFGALRKMEALQREENYIVDTVREYLEKSAVKADERQIRVELLLKYLAERMGVNLDSEVEIYDLVMELLFDLQQAELAGLLSDVRSEGEPLLMMPNEKLQEAERLYIAYQLDEARVLFEELAKAGNARAMYVLARYYYDPDWGWKGADAGDVLAQLYEAESWADDEQKTAVLEELFPRVYELAEQGDVFARHEVAGMFLHGYGTRCDEQKAIYYWRTAAEAGFWDSMSELGNLFLEQEKYKKAAEWFKKLAEAGCDEGWYKLGKIYGEGEGDIACEKEAIRCYQKVYEMQGFRAGDAACDLGIIFDNKEEYKKANEWFRKSGEAGNDWGWSFLADNYADGKGTTEDKDKAIEYYLKAYEIGGTRAGDVAYSIGMIFDGRENYNEANIWFRKAYDWFKKAAEAGSDWGYYKLGNCYLEGKGVAQNAAKAVECFKKAYEMQGRAADYAKERLDALR